MRFAATLLILLTIGRAASGAEVHAVKAPSEEQKPTYTLLYEGSAARYTLIVILGGAGRIGFNENTKDTRTQSALMTQLLSKTVSGRASANVVIFDSPAPLEPNSMRWGDEHLGRVRGVVDFYKKKFHQPLVLFGHSNGSVSASEYLNKYREDANIDGMVLSASLSRTANSNLHLRQPPTIPLLILHHQNDECRYTPFDGAKRSYESIASFSKSVTELAAVTGGQSRGDPCRDGTHMYYGAYEEAAASVSKFVDEHVLKKRLGP